METTGRGSKGVTTITQRSVGVLVPQGMIEERKRYWRSVCPRKEMEGWKRPEDGHTLAHTDIHTHTSYNQHANRQLNVPHKGLLLSLSCSLWRQCTIGVSGSPQITLIARVAQCGFSCLTIPPVTLIHSFTDSLMKSWQPRGLQILSSLPFPPDFPCFHLFTH